MSSPYTAIPKDGLSIISEIPGTEEGYYDLIFAELDKLSKKDKEVDTNDEYKRTRYVIANYVYLIYERLCRNMVREIDYDEVKHWASKNRQLASYLLCKEDLFKHKSLSMEAFWHWISPPMVMEETCMYKPSRLRR